MTERWLVREAVRKDAPVIESAFVSEVHRRWFSTTFPGVAGYVRRQEEVHNRKATASPARNVAVGLLNACADWEAAVAEYEPPSHFEGLLFGVQEANRLVVRVYDIHPFLDGNTRATWSLRNYALLRSGLDPLSGLEDPGRYERSWWSATPASHESLDQAVASELVALEMRRDEHNRQV